MGVGEGLVDGAVDVAVGDFVHGEARGGLRELVQLAAQVDALLVGALGGGGEAPRRAVEDQYFPLEYKVRMGEDDGRA